MFHKSMCGPVIDILLSIVTTIVQLPARLDPPLTPQHRVMHKNSSKPQAASPIRDDPTLEDHSEGLYQTIDRRPETKPHKSI